MTEPRWLAEARKSLGEAEVSGDGTNPVIANWLQKLKAWWKDDEIPWCGLFVAQSLKMTGYPVPHYWMRARSWLAWGTPLAAPSLGCIVIFPRKGGGHVGFVAGRAEDGRLLVLGGNQGNKVSIMPFDPLQVLGYRWPSNERLPLDIL